jgi:hypothetical protein
VLDKTGFVVLTDPITQVNIDFNHDVCYQALFSLEQSLDAGKPLGLKVFGDWPTVYEGLAQLPEPAAPAGSPSTTIIRTAPSRIFCRTCSRPPRSG